MTLGGGANFSTVAKKLSTPSSLSQSVEKSIEAIRHVTASLGIPFKTTTLHSPVAATHGLQYIEDESLYTCHPRTPRLSLNPAYKVQHK